MPRLLLTLLICCCCWALLPAQSAEALRAKRNRLLADLKKTNQELALTRAERGAAVGQANLLRVRIEQRRELIETLVEEVNRNQNRMARDSGVILSLNADMERMKTEYGRSLIVANRSRLSQGWLVFLFSAEGFNDAFRRFLYLRQYRDYRLRQGKAIRLTRFSLEDRLEKLALQKIEQDSLLAAARGQGVELEKELVSQNEIVASLTSSEQALLARVNKQRKESEALAKLVESAITASLEAEADNAAATLEASASSGIAARRGRLAWPARGKITRKFGMQPHPEVSSVKINNSGIDIAVGAATAVTAIFAGRVISARAVPGFRNTLMIRHGKYYSVYSNLAKTRVKTGDQVQAGDPLGNTAGVGAPLHFELWRGKQPLNPERWLAK